MSPGSMTYSETERDTDLAQKSSCSASAQAHYYLAWEKPVVQEAPDIDFTACNRIWDCALMTVGCPTQTFSSNRHYFTHIFPVYFSFP